MLAKLNTRYDEDQIKFLTVCSLLDVRYKNSRYIRQYLDEAYQQLENHVKEICDEHKKDEQN